MIIATIILIIALTVIFGLFGMMLWEVRYILVNRDNRKNLTHRKKFG